MSDRQREVRPDGTVLHTFSDTTAGRELLRQHLVATFGPVIECRARGFGVEIRNAQDKRHADPA